MNKDQYVKRVQRHTCVVCGCEATSGGNWWPRGEVGVMRLYQGLPICWECASRIYVQYQMYDNNYAWRVAPSSWQKLIVEPVKENIENQQIQFEEQCERWKDFDIVDITKETSRSDDTQSEKVLVGHMFAGHEYDKDYMIQTILGGIRDFSEGEYPEGTYFDVVIRKKSEEFSTTTPLRLPIWFPNDLRDSIIYYIKNIQRRDTNGVYAVAMEASDLFPNAKPENWVGFITDIQIDSDPYPVDWGVIKMNDTEIAKDATAIINSLYTFNDTHVHLTPLISGVQEDDKFTIVSLNGFIIKKDD